MTSSIRRLIQVGDIHFPEHGIQSSSVDQKDGSFPSFLIDKMAPTQMSLVVRHIQSYIDRSFVDFLLFMGDLTSWADTDHYRRCLDLINVSFIDGRSFSTRRDDVRVIPGNHDLTRNSDFSIDILRKFSAFDDILRDKEFKTLPNNDSDVIRRAAPGKGSILLYLLNSCFGCGEKKHLPQAVQDALIEKINSMALPHSSGDSSSPLDDTASAARFLHNLADSIDTPLINQDSLASLPSADDPTFFKDALIVARPSQFASAKRAPRRNLYRDD